MKKVSGRLANLTPEQREKLLKKLREQKKGSGKQEKALLKHFRADEQNLQLSFAQQRLWFLDQLLGQNASYNIPALLYIKGNLNVEALKKAFQKLLDQHDALRTRFIQVEGVAKPVVLSKSEFVLRLVNSENWKEKEQQNEIENLALRHAIKPFKLDEDVLIRASLLKIDQDYHALFISMHHIISDAWSMRLLVSQLSEFYNQFEQQGDVQLPENELAYVDFASWQRKQFNEGAYHQQIDFWRSELSDVEVLNFPVDKQRPSQQSFEGDLLEFEIPKNLSDQLKKLAREEGKTLFSVLLLAWQIIIYRYSGQKNFSVGTPVANRAQASLENIIGYFVNTLAIKADLNPELGFIEHLDALQKRSAACFSNQDVPFEKIIDELGLARDMSQSPVFQNFFSFQNDSVEQSFAFNNLDIKLKPIHTRTAKFDLSFDIVDKGDYLQGAIEYSTALFHRGSIERLRDNLLVLIESICIDARQAIKNLDCLSASDLNHQLFEWNKTETDFPKLDIVTQFYQQLEKTPEKTAIICGSQKLSFAELDRESNFLANYLISQGVKPGDYLGICQQRGIAYVVSLLASIKTGAAYLPIDPSYPSERIRLLINQGELAYLLSESHVFNTKLNGDFEECPYLLIDDQDSWQGLDSKRPELNINPEQLLYVIFTSGSTGIPKRTAATHLGESNLVNWYRQFTANQNARYLLISALGFDLGQKNIFTPLLSGGTLVVPDFQEYNPDKIIQAIKQYNITCLNCAPSAFYPLVQATEKFEALESLKQVFLGGESIIVEKILKWKKQSQCLLFNSYGPSECTDIASYYCLEKTEAIHSIPIGRPSDNVKLYLLDENLKLAPLGAYAELYIGGLSVGPGYLGNSALSEKKFIQNPVPGESGRIYATGDIVRYLENGNIEYIGRKDGQIKIRGYRVESSEIVSLILNHEEVKEASVCLKKVQDREILTAYLVADERSVNEEGEAGESGLNIQILKKVLKQSLPDYMIPAAFVEMDTLPLTPNGKVDIKALPEPDLNQLASADFLAPRNEIEQALQLVWQSVLQVERVGVRDNFFELGGDSILSIQIISAARKRNIILTPSQIFRYPTILEQAQLANKDIVLLEAEQDAVEGELLCSPAQHTFFSHISVDETCDDEWRARSHFNQSLKLDLEDRISIQSLKKVIAVLLLQHDVLSVSAEKAAKGIKFRHRENGIDEEFVNRLVSFYELSDTNLSIDQILNEAQRKLDIRTGKLLHCALIEELKAGRRVQSIYLVIHHLVVDGVSWRILLEDLEQLFSHIKSQSSAEDNFSVKSAEQLQGEIYTEKTLSFKQWTSSLQTLLQSNAFNSEKNFWIDTLERIESCEDSLPVKHNNSFAFKNQNRLGFSLNKQITDKFLKQSNTAFGTEANDVLLCALLEALPENHSRQLAISLENHGRELPEGLYKQIGMPDISRTIGWFTSSFPVLIDKEAHDGDWAIKIKSTKEQLRKIPSKGMGYALLESAHDMLRVRKHPLISFNYLGQFGKQASSVNFSIDMTVRSSVVEQSEALLKPTALDIVLFIEDDCLVCDFIYDQDSFELEQVQQYLKAYQEQLESLIDFCSSRTSVAKTPSDFQAAELTQLEIEEIESKIPYLSEKFSLPDLALESVHGLLPTQSGMLFHDIFSGDDNEDKRYVEQFAVALEGEIDLSALEDAWKKVIRRYANLRSCFHWQYKQPLQIVFNEIDFTIKEYDLGEKGYSVSDFFAEDLDLGFKLDSLPLMRVSLLKDGPRKYWMVWSFHHILLDGWSVPLVLNQVFENYILFSDKNTSPVFSPEQAGQSFENFVAWYQSRSSIVDVNDNAFWKSYLNDFGDANSIDLEPIAFPIEADKASLLDSKLETALSKVLCNKLDSFAKRNHLTMNTLIQGAWSILLSYYSGDEDIVFGSTLSGRPNQFTGVEDIVGMFINTLPLRVKLSEDLNLLECLKNIQDTQQELGEHQLSSLAQIQNLVGHETDNALFNSILVFENFPVNEKLKADNPYFKIVDSHSFEKTNYPITIAVEPAEQIKIRVLYDPSIYRKTTMERMLGHLECLLTNFPDSEQSSVFNIPFITAQERSDLDLWNQTETSYPRDATLAALVEKQVRQNPEQIALKFDSKCLTYADLNKKANQFARFLHQQELNQGDRVALFMDRSEALLISALAVSKSGAAYVPLDPAYPQERLEYMLVDCEPAIIVTVKDNKAVLEQALGKASENPTSHFKIFYLDEMSSQLSELDDSNPDYHQSISSEALAYLMYTSGSTGQPKGVCLSHRSIIRLVMNTWYLNLGPKDRIGHICNVCFDASAYEIWGALMNGATLIGFDRETILSEDDFAEKLQAESVTNMLMTTSLFHLYSRHRPEIFSNMRCLLIGGEPLQPQAARQVLEASKPGHLFNVYGPTENGVLTTVFDTWDLSENAKNTPVGKPISNTTVYIVNERNQELPVGVVGELVSGGDGVGLGYWNLPEVSQKTFIENPFSDRNGKRMYRTGDLARRLNDGSFEVLGRMDDQLKIRGFRIEPSEIIKRMNDLPSVADAVVNGVESEGNKKHLVAYVVVKGGHEFDASAAKEHLKEILPTHLVPDFFVEIDKIPITPNGKLDKAKLPKPDFEDLGSINYAAPRNETERTLVDIWQEVLGIGSIGIHDNYFELGGDSIISIQLVSRSKRAGLDLTPKLLFEFPTISQLSQNIKTENTQLIAQQGMVDGEVEILPVQSWFFEQNLKHLNQFNQSLLFKVNGFLTIQSITPVLSAIIKQHDALRLRFMNIESKWLAKHDNSPRSVSALADILSEENFSSAQNPYAKLLAHSQSMQSQLSIEKGPQVKMVLYHLGDMGQRLLIIAHHLVIDGVSWRILLDDINLALQQQSENQVIELGRKTSSLQDYSRVLQEVVHHPLLEESRTFWEQRFSVLENKKQRENKTGKQADIQQTVFTLSREESQLLLTGTKQAYRTEVQELLLLALCQSIQASALDDVCYIDIEGHGRNLLPEPYASKIDLTRTIGWFTNISPFIYESANDNNLSSLIKQFKTEFRQQREFGNFYMLLRHHLVEQENSYPQAEISFNYLGQMQTAQGSSSLALDSEYLNQSLNTIQDTHPENAAIYAMAFTASFQDEQFQFKINFDSVIFEASLIEKLQGHFEKAISELITHCSDSHNFGFTPEDLPYVELEQEKLDQICVTHREHSEARLDAIYPLSPMQEGMLFHSRLDTHSGMYCEQVSVLFEGELNVKVMEQAWNQSIAAHDILRTSFVWEEVGQTLQLVHASAEIDICVLDWRSEENPKTKLKTFLSEDRELGFDFSAPPLMRLHYILWPSVDPGKILGRFVWTYHHILLDGWSMPLLMGEIFSRYKAILNEAPNVTPEATTISGGYQSYIEWLYQQEHARKRHENLGQASENDKFWKQYLLGFEEPVNLSISRSKPEQRDIDTILPRYQEVSTALTQEQTQSLQAFASEHHVTMNTLLQAAWALLLSRYSGEKDIVFGITVSGRPSELKNIESIIGLFINTIPFRVYVDNDNKLDEWLKQILRNQIQLRQFETTPLVDIQAQSDVDGSRALFDSILVFENYPLDDALEKAPQGLEIQELDVFEQTNFPLSLIVLPGQQLEIKMLFDSHLYGLDTIDKVLSHLQTLLLDIISVKESYQKSLGSLDYLGEKERHIIVEDWNDTYRYYPRDSYLQDIVSRQAQEKPDALALSSEQGDICYAELEQGANRLANYMCAEAHGDYRVQVGDRVVICMSRSHELIVSMLAILKCGAVYVPLDPGYPEERQRYMLEDTRARLVITDTENAALVKHLCSNKSLQGTFVYIDVNEHKSQINACSENLELQIPEYIDNEETPAAILYTSGSTGQPKGVCLTHRGLSRMVLNTNYMQLTESDRVAHVSNICFDAASFEVWAALLNGLPLIILDKDIMLNLEKFERELKQRQVSVLLITTALFNLVAKERVTALEEIRYLFFGGEACDVRMVRRVFEHAKPEHLLHMYGPSENSTYATWYEVSHIEKEAKSIPIGKPVSNTRVYIMNQQGALLPPGVAGEIVCAGDGLALGYLNKPEQTQKAFVQRNLPGQEAEKMYLTGDLGVYLPDGNIEILGRIDNQVKIRGHRIEPEEIITRINALPMISKAHVLVKEDKEGKKYLLAYYVPEQDWVSQQSEKSVRIRSLKAELKALMPDYMVPGFYTEIDELPLTPNGKIDTKALPETDYLQGASEYQAPGNALETSLVAIWQDVLGQEKIGVNDDFFELGGHSLLATQIHSRIRQQLEIDIPLRTLFELPTIREFSEFWQALSMNQDHEEGDDEDFEEGEL